MFSSKNKFIFIHPQKTGGTTISELILPYTKHVKIVHPNKLIGGFTYETHQGVGKHCDINTYATVFPRMFFEFANDKRTRAEDGWFFFGSVRHPVQRLLSWWLFEKKTKTGQAKGELSLENLKKFAKKWYTGYSYQKMFCIDDEVVVNNIVKLEDIVEQLPPVLIRCGVKVPYDIPHANKNNLNEDLSPDEMEGLYSWMYKRFPFDFEQYGYETHLENPWTPTNSSKISKDLSMEMKSRLNSST